MRLCSTYKGEQAMPLSNKGLETRFCRQNYYSLKSEMPPIIAVNTIRKRYLRKRQPITFQRKGGELKEKTVERFSHTAGDYNNTFALRS